jgi:penicillin-binding protein-related factor A (putative recombinase)
LDIGKKACSFLKKRTKKLLSVLGDTEITYLKQGQREEGKSFLLLFFKKEVLFFICGGIWQFSTPWKGGGSRPCSVAWAGGAGGRI